MMVEIRRLLVVALAALACVCMWGCSDDETFKWDESRSGAKVVGFVDDSLVMVGDYRCWSEVTDRWNGEYIDTDGCGQERLCVYNYRVQEDGPRWCDSLLSENMTGMFGGQMTDSVIWGGEASKSVQLWKIGGRPHEIELEKSTEGCSVKFKISSLKQWLDGSFIGRNGESLLADNDTCNYAVLDTVKRTLIYRRLDKDLKWIKKCDDVRAWGDDVYCVILDEGGNSVVLKNENDTIPAHRKFAIGGFWGNMIKLNGNICLFSDDEISCSDVTWRGNELKFYRNNEVVVEY